MFEGNMEDIKNIIKLLEMKILSEIRLTGDYTEQ